jgi:hypothetical protein
MIKICSKCKEEKEYSNFNKHKSGKNGLTPVCKDCQKQWYEANKEAIAKKKKQWYKVKKQDFLRKRKQYYKSNKETIAEKEKQYYKCNKEVIAEKGKKYRESNKKAIAEKGKQYRQANKKAFAERDKLYYEANKKAFAERNKEYYEANKEAIKQYNKANKEVIAERLKQYNKKRLKTDPIYKFKSNVRSLIYHSFKRGNNNFRKNTKTEQILGCKIEEFRKYIQAKFKKGMSFDNHGQWHLDHIVPLSIAATEEEIIKLNHYTNFQPLWAEDNLSKSDKIIETQLILI